LYAEVMIALVIIFLSFGINFATNEFMKTIIIDPPNAIIILDIVYSQ